MGPVLCEAGLCELAKPLVLVELPLLCVWERAGLPLRTWLNALPMECVLCDSKTCCPGDLEIGPNPFDCLNSRSCAVGVPLGLGRVAVPAVPKGSWPN